MSEAANPLVVADYSLLVGFFVVMLVIGFYYSRKMHDLKDYFGGGNQVPWWLSSISYYMTTFSASSFVAYSALAYKYGWVPVTIWWMMACTMIVIGRFVAARWRRVATTSPMEFLEERFGLGLRQGLSWLGVVYLTIDDGLKIFAIGAIMSAVLGFPMQTTIICCGTIMLAYTFLGGLWAVLVTDFVQFIVLLAGVLVLFPLALVEVGGFAGFLDQASADFFSPTAGKYTWVYIGFFIFLMLLDNCTRWSLVQRFYSVKRDSDARRVCYVVAALQFVGAPVLYFPAMAASIFMGGVENPDQIYGLLCRHLLPVGLLGMMVAAMFSATMSLLSSDYNAIASVLTTDIYKRLFARSASNRSLVLAGRVFTLIVGAIAVGIALLVTRVGGSATFFDIVVAVFSTLSPPLTIPVVAGLLSRRVSNAGAISAALTGIVVGLTARLVGPTVAGGEIPEAVLMSISLFSTVTGMIVGTVLAPGSPEQKEKVRRFLDGVESRDEVQEAVQSPQESSASPALIIGTAVGSLGALLALAVLLTVPVKEGALSIGVGSGMLLVGCIFVVLSRSHNCKLQADSELSTYSSSYDEE